MATSLLTACDHDGSLNGSEETRPENAKRGGRRRSKMNESTQKKKLPQRGMGVAQLERLRHQEMWKKMSKIDSLSLQTHQFGPSPFTDPMQLPKFTPYGGVAQTGFHEPLVKPVFSDRFQADPYGFRAPISKELCSMPSTTCYSERCGVCHRKKPINGCNFMGFNVGNINGENHSSYINKEAEVVAVHRKGSSSSGGESVVLMEYDFFPSGTCNEELLIKVGSESSSSVAPPPTPSSSIDLSLKLSY